MNILVIGSISTDYVVQAKRRPAVGETIKGDAFATAFGGKGANQAVAAARLGASTRVLGCVGSDLQGQSLIENLQANNIQADKVAVIDDGTSGMAFITLAEGDNSIIFVPGTNDDVLPEYIKQHLDAFESADMVIIQNEIPIETTQYVIDYCDQIDVKVLLNPAPALKLDQEYIDKVDYLTPNETEFDEIFQGKLLEDALESYPNKLIVTLGERGAIFHNGEKLVQVPALTTDNVVDTTGAGDTFNGAFAVAVGSGLSIEDSISFANIASSLSIQKSGAQGGIPTLDEVKAHEAFDNGWEL